MNRSMLNDCGGGSGRWIPCGKLALCSGPNYLANIIAATAYAARSHSDAPFEKLINEVRELR